MTSEERPLLLELEQEPVTAKQEVKYIVESSVPLVISFLLQYLLSVTSVYASGQLGSQELAAATLGLCTFNITALAIYQGMATSLDTFCSQAYGQGNHHNVGLYFQRCSLIMLAVTMPLTLVWWNSGAILLYMVADPELVQMAQTYLRILIPSTPALLLFEAGKRFLQAQHIYHAATHILVVATPLNFVLNWLLVWHPTYGLKFKGAPLCSVIINWFVTLSLAAYVYFIDGKKCWGGLDLRKALQNWGPMLRFAVPGVVMVEAEYLAFEILTILAAAFGTNSLAAQSIASNVGSLAFQLPFAVAVVFTTRIGHFVGLRNIRAAKLVIRISILAGAIISTFNFSVVFFGRHFWSSLFSEAPEVTNISNQILILVGLNQIVDSFNVLGAGILRSQGRQRIGSILNLISYYVVALPLGYILAFKFDFGLKGLWLGLICGVIFLTSTEAICVYSSNWALILKESDERHDN